jgi:hypothetical protein
MEKEYIDKLSFDIIGAAIEVHKYLGKGLLESVYHECMKEELKYRKLNFETEKSILPPLSLEPTCINFPSESAIKL